MNRSKLSKSSPLVRSETNRSGGLGSSAIAALRLRAEFDLRDVAPVAAASQDGPIYEGSEVLPAHVADRHGAEFDMSILRSLNHFAHPHRERQFFVEIN